MDKMIFFDNEDKEYYVIDTDEKAVQLYRLDPGNGEKNLFIETTPLELFNMLNLKDVRKLTNTEKAKLLLLERDNGTR